MVTTAARLRRLLRDEQVELIHAHGSASLPLVVLATRGLRPRVRVCFTWQDSESVLGGSGWRRSLLRWSIRRCDAVSGSCASVVERLRTSAGLANVGTFHGGVPITPAPVARDSAVPAIIWVGRIVPAKDPQMLIRAVAKLHAEGLRARVVIIGKPLPSTQWYYDQTRTLGERLGVTGYLELPGYVPDCDMPGLLQSAEVGVQTSHTEGLSIALMEHMMAGLAIVATDVGDTRVAVQDQLSGLLIPARDENSLADALRRVLTDVPLRQRLQQAARARAIAEYSIDAMARRALADYDRILGNR